MKMYKIFFLFSLFSFIGCSFTSSSPQLSLKYQNTILIIGDGMGPEQIDAANYFGFGILGRLSFEQFPYYTRMTTYSLNNSITDSAAAATAMATGVKVNNGVVSVQPFGYKNLDTILEIASSEGKKTGLVSSAHILHATPAAFGAHSLNRSDYVKINNDYFRVSKPNLIFGGGKSEVSISYAIDMGYDVVQNEIELNLLSNSNERVLGVFGNDHMPYMLDGLGIYPELSEMAEKAIEILNGENGFFLMIEAGRIDHAGHINDIERNINEVLELSDTVEKVFNWASSRNDTIIIVTADHETGGLVLEKNNGLGIIPDVSWSTSGHTSTPVPVYIWGLGGGSIIGNITDNTDIFNQLLKKE